MTNVKDESLPRKVKNCVIAAGVLATFVSAQALWAQEPYVYPTKKQSKQQMEDDKYACYQWAKNQTGVDPMQASAAPSSGRKGGALRGAAGGAAAGAAIGAIGGNAGKGAAIGAASGGIIGGARQRRSAKAEAQQQSTSRGEYDRAWGACMEGKGYTVK